MKIRDSHNQFGTKISIHRCDECWNEFTVCPAVENEGWENCLGPECSSYDADRDADRLFGSGRVLREEKGGE